MRPDRVRPDRDAARRKRLNPNRVQAAFVEEELDAAGKLAVVATLLTTGRECAFRCVFCDLWKSTLPHATPPGAIVQQLDAALPALASASVIKLYNASNWFDPRAVPPSDWPAIAKRLQPFERVVVENHPKLCHDAAVQFRDVLKRPLEVAIGLECLDPHVLPKLRKSMTLDDVTAAMKQLRRWGVTIRAFVLTPPPLPPKHDDAVLRTVRFAFENGAEVVSLLPLRGTMLAGSPRPSFSAIRDVLLATAPELPRRLFVDLWDADDWCSEADQARLTAWNRTQLPASLIT